MNTLGSRALVSALMAGLACGGLGGLWGCTSGPGRTSTFATATDAGEVGAQPEVGADHIDDPRQIRAEAAMRGLRIEDGRVLIDRVPASDVVRGLVGVNAADEVARGQELLGINHFTPAMEAFRNAILLAPGNAEAYEGLGDAFIGRRRDPQALACYATAVSLAPANPVIRFKHAEATNRVGDLDGWIAGLSEVLALDPTHGHAHSRLAVAMYYTGDASGSRRHIALAREHGHEPPPQLLMLLDRLEARAEGGR